MIKESELFQILLERKQNLPLFLSLSPSLFLLCSLFFSLPFLSLIFSFMTLQISLFPTLLHSLSLSLSMSPLLLFFNSHSFPFSISFTTPPSIISSLSNFSCDSFLTCNLSLTLSLPHSPTHTWLLPLLLSFSKHTLPYSLFLFFRLTLFCFFSLFIFPLSD